MKYLKKFNESLFSKIKEIGLSKYLIKYNVTNYLANKEEWELGKYSKEWKSKDYEYIISTNNKDEAKDKLESIWGKEVESFTPKPKLNIISVSLDDNRFTNGSFKNELKYK